MEDIRNLDSKWKLLKKDFEQCSIRALNLDHTDKTSSELLAASEIILAVDVFILRTTVEKKEQQLRVQLFEENQRKDSGGDISPDKIQRLQELLYHFNNFVNYFEADYNDVLDRMFKQFLQKFAPGLWGNIERMVNVLKTEKI